jgi:serine-type D-Ala-D-Ala carboxypeptidase (penicillin-binding protein 5/6)
MTDLQVLQQARARRAANEARAGRARRRHRVAFTALTLVLGAAALLAFMAPIAAGPTTSGFRATRAAAATPGPNQDDGYGSALAPARERVNPRFKLPLASGVLFDVRSGRVLWEKQPQRVLPIASLTKMMTALLVAGKARPADRVLITPAAVHYSGSGVGLLPKGKRVPLLALLYGLLLPSGNDAAIALAQHVAGTQSRFIAMMNARARQMGLGCTHFTTVSGIVDQGNHSCATDLAILARAILRNRLLKTIVGSRSAVLPFPIKGGKLYLYNNNPLLVLRYPGADGVKTGYTQAAGRCLVATARRGRTWLGVVLLHSGDPSDQAQKLLNAGFARLGA